MEMKVEYTDRDSFYLIRLSNGKYYYGDGSTVNAFGISANQFLRFHPYMDYVSDQGITPPQHIAAWIEENA